MFTLKRTKQPTVLQRAEQQVDDLMTLIYVNDGLDAVDCGALLDAARVALGTAGTPWPREHVADWILKLRVASSYGDNPGFARDLEDMQRRHGGV